MASARVGAYHAPRVTAPADACVTGAAPAAPDLLARQLDIEAPLLDVDDDRVPFLDRRLRRNLVDHRSLGSRP